MLVGGGERRAEEQAATTVKQCINEKANGAAVGTTLERHARCIMNFYHTRLYFLFCFTFASKFSHPRMSTRTGCGGEGLEHFCLPHHPPFLYLAEPSQQCARNDLFYGTCLKSRKLTNLVPVAFVRHDFRRHPLLCSFSSFNKFQPPLIHTPITDVSCVK